MLTNVLARVAGVVGDIIKAPVEFLGNLIAGIKGGILKFKDNIVEHLRKGLMGWLFGALAEGGVELPGTFDLRGIVKLLVSLFGLTWANIRNRLVRQIGEKAMGAVEKGVSIFQTLAAQGVVGLWEMLLEKLGDIKEMILEQVKDFVVTRIITAGITWLIGLLNPAAAFVKACKLIYDVVMFFVSNVARIARFVNTVIDSVADVVKGNVSGVVNKINDVLGQMVPIIIGFFASVIGLGGVGQKIREIVGALQKPINKALDFVIKTGLKLAGPIIRGVKGISGKVKAKVAAGTAWAKGKVAAGKQRLRDLAAFLPGAAAFRGGGEAHRIWIEQAAPRRIMVASNPTEAGALISYYGGVVDGLPETEARDRVAKADLRAQVAKAREDQARLRLEVDAVTTMGDPTVVRRQLTNKQHNFALTLRQLFDAVHRARMRFARQMPPYASPGSGAMTSGTVTCVAAFTVASTEGQRPYPTAGGAGAAGPRVRRGRRGDEAHTVHGFGASESRMSGAVGGFAVEAPPVAEGAGPTEHKAELVTRSTGDACAGHPRRGPPAEPDRADGQAGSELEQAGANDRDPPLAQPVPVVHPPAAAVAPAAGQRSAAPRRRAVGRGLQAPLVPDDPRRRPRPAVEVRRHRRLPELKRQGFAGTVVGAKANIRGGGHG